MKTKAQLIAKIITFRTVSSKTGRASYSSFKVDGDIVHFIRDNTKEKWSIDISKVYDVYSKEKFIDTTTLRKHISGRAYSPSLAILMAAGFCDEDGNRLT